MSPRFVAVSRDRSLAQTFQAIFVLVQREEPRELIREHLRQANLLTQARIAEDESENERYRDQPAESTTLDRPVHATVGGND